MKAHVQFFRFSFKVNLKQKRKVHLGKYTSLLRQGGKQAHGPLGVPGDQCPQKSKTVSVSVRLQILL